MPIPETRDPNDPLEELQKRINQSEDDGANLATVVAGTQDGKNVNFLSIESADTPQPPPVTLVPIKPTPQPFTDADSLLTPEEEAAAHAQAERDGKTIIFIAPIFDRGTMSTVAVCRDGPPDSVLTTGTP